MSPGFNQVGRVVICPEEVVGVVKFGRVIKRLMFLMGVVLIIFFPSALVYINFLRLLRGIFGRTHSDVDLFGLQLP